MVHEGCALKTKIRDPIYQENEDLKTQMQWQTTLITELQEKLKRKEAELKAYSGPATPGGVYRKQRERLAKLNSEVLSEIHQFCKANGQAGLVKQTRFLRWLHEHSRPITQKTNDDTITARIRELYKAGELTRIKPGLYRLAS